MSTIVLGYISALGYLVLVFGFTWIIEKKLHISVEIGRKILHILLGFIWFILIYFFNTTIHLIILPIVFVIINSLSYKYKILSMMERSDNNHPGTIYFAITTLILTLIVTLTKQYVFESGVAVLFMSVGDGFAGIFGQLKKGNHKLFDKKTLYGFLACFTSMIMVLFIFSKAYSVPIPFITIVSISLACAFIELISVKGLDNLTVPISCIILLYLFSTATLSLLPAICLVISTIMAICSLFTRTLTNAGGVVAWTILIIISLTIGYAGLLLYIIPFILIFIVNTLIKFNLSSKTSKNSNKRGAIQIISNGLVAFILMLISFFTKLDVYLLCAGVVLISSFSDSIASDVGIFSKQNPIFIKTMRRINKGVSGAVSLLGLLSSFIACFSLSIIFLLLIEKNFNLIAVVVMTLISYSGVIFDSIIGAYLQVKYINTQTNDICDKLPKFNTINYIKYSGVNWINNNLVNFISSIFVAIISLLSFNYLLY